MAKYLMVLLAAVGFLFTSCEKTPVEPEPEEEEETTQGELIKISKDFLMYLNRPPHDGFYLVVDWSIVDMQRSYYSASGTLDSTQRKSYSERGQCKLLFDSPDSYTNRWELYNECLGEVVMPDA